MTPARKKLIVRVIEFAAAVGAILAIVQCSRTFD